jgi:hypothetical protein
MICETLQSKEVPVSSPGVGQPYVVEDTPQDCVKKSLATYAVQTSGTRKLEEASGKAAAWPNSEAEAVLAENRAVGAMARLNAKAKVTMGHLDAKEGKDRPDAEEKGDQGARGGRSRKGKGSKERCCGGREGAGGGQGEMRG